MAKQLQLKWQKKAQMLLSMVVKKADVDTIVSEIKEQSKLNTAALRYLLKYNLEEMYFKFKAKQFKLTPIDIEQWNNEFSVYSECGGNGTVAEFNAEIQTRIRENMRSE